MYIYIYIYIAPETGRSRRAGACGVSGGLAFGRAPEARAEPEENREPSSGIREFGWNQTRTDEHMHRRVGTPGKIHISTCFYVQSAGVPSRRCKAPQGTFGSQRGTCPAAPAGPPAPPTCRPSRLSACLPPVPRLALAGWLPAVRAPHAPFFGRGDDTAGCPHRAKISQFELFELILLLILDKQFPFEQFEATASQSTVPSPPLNALSLHPLTWTSRLFPILSFLARRPTVKPSSLADSPLLQVACYRASRRKRYMMGNVIRHDVRYYVHYKECCDCVNADMNDDATDVD